ncbi:MAG: hypothetical protein IKT72_03920, partial [Clostridia bacterium]|nr:hypothetical protein [Clostridia bacterium]
ADHQHVDPGFSRCQDFIQWVVIEHLLDDDIRRIDARLVDYVAMDVKAPLYDYEPLLLAEGDASLRVLESIELLKRGVLPYEFRTTLVAEMIDEAGVANLAELLRGADKLFLQKFEDRGGNLAEGLSAVPLEMAKAYAEILSKAVKQVVLRGYSL